MTADAAKYSPRVRELFADLPGAVPLSAGRGAIVTGEAIALERGAWVRFEARIDSGRVMDCVFRAWGCPHTLAASAWVSLAVRSGGMSEAQAIDATRLRQELGAPREKMGRMLVVEDALRSLLERARGLQ